MKQYLKSIERRLNLPREVRQRVMSDLRSSIAARREAGQADEAIMAELGTPKQVAAELNEQMKEFAFRRSPWRWAALAAAVFTLLRLLTRGAARMEAAFYTWIIGQSKDVGIIGGADGPTAVFVTTAPLVGYELLLGLAVLAVWLLVWWRLSHLKKR